MKSKKSYLASIIISLISALFLMGCAQEQTAQPIVSSNYPGNVSGQTTSGTATVPAQSANVLSGIYDGKLLRTADSGSIIEQAMTLTVDITSQQGTLNITSSAGDAFALTNFSVPILLVNVDYYNGKFLFISRIVSESPLFEGSMALALELQMNSSGTQVEPATSRLVAYDCIYSDATYCGEPVDGLGFTLISKR